MRHFAPLPKHSAAWPLPLALFILSTWDGIATWIGLQAGYYIEINPVMSYLATLGAWPFFVVKTVLMLVAVYVLLKSWNQTVMARYVGFFALGLYTCIGIIHLAPFLMEGITR